MAQFNAAVALLGCLALLQGATGMRLAGTATLDKYSFEQFALDFGRNYAAGGSEYHHRHELFKASLLEIFATNARNAKMGSTWKAGLHPFMDWTVQERQALHGYKPSREHRGSMAALQTRKSGNSLRRSSLKMSANLTRSHSLSQFEAPTLRQQGNCGSCWAISAVEAIEAQLIKNGAGSPRDVRLSAQALVDCVPNPQHCGGKGGCDGATGELAYAYVRDHGIPLESGLPYEARTEACPTQQFSKVAKVDGWNALPSNQAEPLMQALVQSGAAVVAVDANNWFNYDSGVFDGCEKDATLGHAVLAVGYGEDADLNKKYWKIQNSWGSNWGEHGHIRLTKHEDPGSWCGQDKDPSEGLGCDGGPSEVTVCGMCGILFDPIIPENARIEDASSSSSSSSIGSYTPKNSFDSALPAAYTPFKPEDSQPPAQTEDARMAALMGFK